MSISAGARKCDLKLLAEELGETVNGSHKLKYLKKMILASKEHDEESAKEWLNTIINERIEREENERRQEEIAGMKTVMTLVKIPMMNLKCKDPNEL
ncbi:hypothetical protein AVEN_152104-1, partial [Araneus ventricosus]